MTSKPLPYIILFILFASITILIWFDVSYFYQDSNHPRELLIIKAPTHKIKTKPDSPGGTKILNMDKSVYGLFSKDKNSNSVKENILPKPEDPILNESHMDEPVEALE